MRTSTSSPRRTSGAEARRHGIQPQAAARRRKPVRRPAVFSQRGASARTGMKRAGAARPRCGHGRFTRGRGRAVRRARLRARRPGRRPPDRLAEARSEEPRPPPHARDSIDRGERARQRTTLSWRDAAGDGTAARLGSRLHPALASLRRIPKVRSTPPSRAEGALRRDAAGIGVGEPAEPTCQDASGDRRDPGTDPALPAHDPHSVRRRRSPAASTARISRAMPAEAPAMRRPPATHRTPDSV
ncbi:hypothetical protein SAMN02799643_00119 [Methylobacterium sp. UNCCL125]|nr:hypothetical protein SAMN02799643_00119 [Methylobacterium sp. UNCCL125]